MQCSANQLAAQSACLACLGVEYLRLTEISLLCAWANSPGANTDPLVTDWKAAVIANGGAAPSDFTLAALNTFVTGLKGAGLDAKMLAVNCIVPDSLIAAQTPIIHNKGYAIWQNVGHTDSELTVNGLSGIDQDPGHYLITGVNPSTDLSGPNSFGMTLYSYDANANTRADFAAIQAPDYAQLLCCYGGTAYFNCWNTGADGQISGVALTNSRGYTSGNRTSATAAAIYVANSGVAHQAIAGPNTGPGIGNRPNLIIPLGCYNLAGNFLQAGSKRYSFAAIHLGLTQAESAQFYTLIQALRTALGGGFV